MWQEKVNNKTHTIKKISCYPNFTLHWEFPAQRNASHLSMYLLRIYLYAHIICQLSVNFQWNFMLEPLLFLFFKNKSSVLLYPFVFWFILIPDTVSWITFVHATACPYFESLQTLENSIWFQLLSFYTFVREIWI